MRRRRVRPPHFREYRRAVGLLAVALAVALPVGVAQVWDPVLTRPSSAGTDVDSGLARVVADPSHLVIPSLGVNAPMVPLVLNPDRTLRPPDDAVHAGWYAGGTAVGQLGTSVIAGHFDSETGPGVFYELGNLVSGDRFAVLGGGGTAAEFIVDRVEQYSKDGFPSDEVYGASPNAQVRLITCGGTFDYETGHYQDNVVVYATLIA